MEQSKRANVGHIGSALSVADMMAVLFTEMSLSTILPDGRDRFVLSKGHAALALYGALHLSGRMDAATLDTYCADGSKVGVHPECDLHGVDFSTGSLGHGLSIAAGAALAARLDNSNRRVFALLSDAECNEGSVWEAVMFAAHHKLSNLIVLIDLNGQQALGYTCDVIDLEPMAEKWTAFGWHAVTIDGHDATAITECIAVATERPKVLICKTTFGKGVSFMESQIAWHYLPMSDQDYVAALAECK